MSVYIPILVAVVAAVATALFGVWSYHQQKNTDRKNELIHRRMKEYERYLTAYRANASLNDFNGYQAWGSPEMIETHAEYWLAYSSLFQIASDGVLLSVAEFHKFAWMEETDYFTGSEAWIQEFRRLYATMIIEMRKNAFEETKLRKEVVEQYLPYNFPYDGALAASAQAQLDKIE